MQTVCLAAFYRGSTLIGPGLLQYLSSSCSHIFSCTLYTSTSKDAKTAKVNKLRSYFGSRLVSSCSHFSSYCAPHKQAAKEAKKAKVNKYKILFWSPDLSCLVAHKFLVYCTRPSIQTGCPKTKNGKGEQIKILFLSLIHI